MSYFYLTHCMQSSFEELVSKEPNYELKELQREQIEKLSGKSYEEVINSIDDLPW